MKLPSVLFVLLLVSFGTKSWAQHYRILLTSDDLERPDSASLIRYISSSEASGITRVLYKDGRREKIKNATIWGYADNRNHIYRFFNGKTYKVKSLTGPITYEREEQRYTGFKPMSIGNYQIKYMSNGLDGEVTADSRL